ncbi:MAG: ethylbenzene dehydrogenase-related protein [Chloroflexi bacterium]|nr:ethylbenzene dehydrogenase-related protein [Chloroflexota bacterium]MDA1002465.1 ethylbenzene dehydrogenase-related protein [Chloroflexota bacterium]MQC27516.1 hypothetical protein [Chloroflexota bacterium]
MLQQLIGSRGRGALLVTAVVGVALFAGGLQLVPVSAQTLTLEAARAPEGISAEAPWDRLWELAPRQEVPLSSQQIALPFGGGSVTALTARALQDGTRLYLLLEWADAEADDAVNGVAEFSDAAAVQFPSIAGSEPPFTMGAPGQPVNIWQWKAVWQADLAGGFTTSQDRYPNTLVDGYLNGDDPLYKTALAAGNPLAQRDHDSPIENLLSEGFGTLTHAALQDVAGAGEWRDGRWRALFVRALEPADGDYASFAVGTSTSVAFAVWEGAADDRNGQKSIAPFIELKIGDADVAARGRFGAEQVLIIIVIALSGAAVAAFLYASARSNARAA